MNNLVKVRNYALYRGCTESYIYRLIRECKINSVEIDGVKFIRVSEEEYKQIKSK